jgi:two-component system NtrC family sensor kinase
LLREGKPIGMLVLMRGFVEAFTDKQIELVETFAAQAVIAIENTRLLSELRQRTDDLSDSLERQTATAEILSSISNSMTETKPVFDAIVRNLLRLFGTQFATVQLFREGIVEMPAGGGQPGFEKIIERYPRPLDDTTVSGQAMLSKQVIQYSPVIGNRLVPATSEQIAREVGFDSIIAAPMLLGDKVIGSIVVAHHEPRVFDEKRVALIKSFADQAVIAIENARLFSELRQRTDDLSESLQQQTATADVLKVISRSAFDLKIVLRTLVESAARLCEAQQAIVTQRGNDGLYRLAASFGYPEKFEEYMKQNPLAPGRATTTGRVALEGKVIHIPDVLADPEYVFPEGQQLGGFRSNLGVPLLRDGVPIGAFVLSRPVVKPFTDKQIELAETFADQAVIAIENVRLLNELRESLQQQTATSDVLKVISSSLNDLKPVFETIGQRAEKLCDAEISAISMVRGDQIHLVSIHGVTEEGIDAVRRGYPSRRDDETLTARAIRSATICHVSDVLSDPLYQRKDAARVSGFRSGLAVPMIREGQVIGAIFVSRKQAGLFTDAQVQLLKTFADQAVIAIENVRLFNETKDALAQQTATADVLKLISRSAFDLRMVLQTLIESAARFCDADKATILREKDGAFYRTETYGFSREFIDHFKNIPVEADRGSASGRSLLDGRVVHIPDVTADPEYTMVDAQRLGDYRTILCVPMLREGAPIGVLILTRSEVRPFTDKQIELVTTFADQAAIAIENVRLFESVEARTRELTKSLADLRTTQDRLVQTQKLASLGQLTAGIAHEIKNPLNFVNNFSGVSVELIDELRQALAGANLDSKLRAEVSEIADTLQGNLDKVVQHGKRADAIVKNMLLHSREGSGEHRLVDVNAIVEESLNLAYHGARAEKQGFNITMERSLDPAAGEADVFPQDITRALLNLISNGFYAATKRKAETNGGDYEPILVAATRNLGDRVEIRIRDNGTGIPLEVKEKIFNPFFTTKPAGEGTGLGLSISHDIIVKQHGGSIEVDTQPGEFTEFTIVLPRAAVFLAERA